MDVHFVIRNGSSREDILANFADQYINEVPRTVSFDIAWSEDLKVIEGTITVAIRGIEHESGSGHDFILNCGIIAAQGHAGQWVQDIVSDAHQTLKAYFNTKRRFGGFTLKVEQPVPVAV